MKNYFLAALMALVLGSAIAPTFAAEGDSPGDQRELSEFGGNHLSNGQ